MPIHVGVVVSQGQRSGVLVRVMVVSVPAVTGPDYEPEPGQREREEVNGGPG